MNWQTLQEQVAVFSKRLNEALLEIGIQEECKGLEIDHICVRLKDSTDINNLRNELEGFGQIISAVQVNGREIMIIQLYQPLNLGLWQTYGIELPYPKSNHKYEDGWEHAEFVLKGAENTMGGVRNAFSDKFTTLDRELLESKYSYSEDEPHADGDQISNPTIGLKVGGIGIKFHANPIQVVVGFEK